jgi:septal ring factor EnvC (AmiA/AmiB activator)
MIQEELKKLKATINKLRKDQAFLIMRCKQLQETEESLRDKVNYLNQQIDIIK